MRARRHEIKLRLNDREFTRLNDMVARSIFSREEFIRMVLCSPRSAVSAVNAAAIPFEFTST